MKKPPSFEMRATKVIGTHYVQHSIHVNGEQVHAQLSPYSEEEIEQRINQYIRPMATQPLKPDNWGAVAGKRGRPKAADKMKSDEMAGKYDWRTGRVEQDNQGE